MRQQPWWRRIRRYFTKCLFGYVNCRDFGMAVTNEQNINELQAALDYCSNVHIDHTVVLKQNQTITGSFGPDDQAEDGP